MNDLSVLDNYTKKIWGDLSQCFSQKTRTTKHDRREKTLAYLLEVATFEMVAEPGIKNVQEKALELIKVVGDLQEKTVSQEAKVSLERSFKRLSEILNNPQYSGKNKQCFACNEYYSGGNHVCNNKTAKSKDGIMGYDDSFI